MADREVVEQFLDGVEGDAFALAAGTGTERDRQVGLAYARWADNKIFCFPRIDCSVVSVRTSRNSMPRGAKFAGRRRT